MNTPDTAERRGDIRVTAVLSLSRLKTAHPFTDAASEGAGLRQDGRTKGRDSVLALFTTAVAIMIVFPAGK